MTAADFLLQLRNLGIKMWVDGEQLRISAPKNAVTAELRAELKARKAELVRFLRQRAEGGSAAIEPAPREAGKGLPLSYGQERLWLLYQMGEDFSAYNMPVTLHLRGPLDPDALAWAFGEVVRRHEILRTSFAADGDTARQVVAEAAPAESFELPLIDVSDAADPLEEARARATALATETFVITRLPLSRFALLRLGAQEHVLSVTLSHIIGDGWSYDVLLGEVRQLYAAKVTGKGADAAGLPELTIQYADFAIWQRQWWAWESERLLGYWKPRLDGVATLELPTDRPRPGIQTFGGDKCAFAFPRKLSEKLQAVGQEEGCTFFMTVLAAFKVLLARYARQDDIAVGTAIANRDRAETQPLIGMFMNTLVMRTDLSGEPGFRECLRRVREVALGAYQHQEVPFEQLVVELRPERDPSRNPLFQVAFLLDEASAGVQLGDLQVEDLDLEHITAKFDLTLAMRETADGLRGVFEFNVDLFDAATIDRMAAHFEQLVAGLVGEPDRCIWEQAILTAEESARLQPAPAVPVPLGHTVHELVAEQAKVQPDALALAQGDRSLTYAEFDRRANQLAHHLRARGVGPGALVGVLLERTPEMVCALLGVMKAGGAYVPLDPANPAARQAVMIEDAGMPVLLTQESLLSGLPDAVGAEVLRIDRDAERIAAESEAAPEPKATVEDLAYVIFTSGSTGRPKGVQIQHRALLNLIFWHRDTYEVTAADRATQIAGLAFDASVWELWPYLTAGASIHLPDEATRAEPHLLLQWLHAQKITLSFVPTPLAEVMLEDPCPADMPLRAMLVGGDKLNHAPPAGLPFALINHYGPTENTVVATATVVPPDADAGPPPIGVPIRNVEVLVVDPHGQPVPTGVPGELWVGGASLAAGYHNRPELTAERFVEHPSRPGQRFYRTGDQVRYRADGNIEFIGRIDHQVKMRGFRIELGEIEQVLNRHEGVGECAVVSQTRQRTGEPQLVAYAVAAAGSQLAEAELRDYLRDRVPEYMVPAAVAVLGELPLTPNGKVDRANLSARDVERSEADRESFVPPTTATEEMVAEIWKEVLGIDDVGRHDNFFDLGGHSALVVQLRRKLQKKYDVDLSIAEVFQFPTVAAMAEHLDGGASEDVPFQDVRDRVARQKEALGQRYGKERAMTALAVIGMSGRYPKASNLDQYWENLRNGIECITFFTVEESIESGVEPELARHENYIGARAILDDIETWDPSFFGVNPREAEAWDPQQRLFLECSYEAMENAGYDPLHTTVPVGVFAGCQPNSYAENNVARHRSMSGMDEALFDHRFLPTRVSYKLNLKGPGVFVYSACSTSLVSIVQACQSLQDYRCDMAIAGGTAVGVPQKIGHVYRKGEIYSPDGHCRPFDADGEGTLSGEGIGAVVLKRLDDALRDGDHIRAVIKAAAINNDGSNKVGFTAPSVEGQAEVVATAIAQAEIDPATIGYVEGHGTATQLGDPIEVGALTRAYRAYTDKKGYCAIGSVKGNIAHLDTGAGVAGFIKAVLSVENAEIAPTLHFKKPNPELDLENTPFYVNSELVKWDAKPRRAGVSSFGFGGTNAHIILEEAPAEPVPAPGREQHLITLSAKSKKALEEMAGRVVEHLQQHPDQSIADVAFTLQQSRSTLPHRRAVVCADTASAIKVLSSADPRRVFSGVAENENPPVVFMFPGQGAQYANMGRGLYESEGVYRDCIDECSRLLESRLGLDLRTLLYPDADQVESAAAQLAQTRFTQPAVFVVEYALARLVMSWGVQPAGMVGHSVGEFVAATLAGVFTLEAALELVAARGAMMQDLPEGDMLSVPLPEEELEPLLGDELSLAAVNGPSACVASGPAAAVAALEKKLTDQGLPCRVLHTSHAFHSAMMAPIVEPFTALVRKADPKPAQIPCVSTVTGSWIDPADWADPEYWARNLRQAVRFSDAAHELLSESKRVLLEIGPGQTLSSLVRQHTAEAEGATVLSSMRQPKESQSDLACLLGMLGKLWLAGGAPDWTAFHSGAARRRVPLPTYPFQRRRYWLDPVAVPTSETTGAPKASAPGAAVAAASAPAVMEDHKKSDVGNWFYVPSWSRTHAPKLRAGAPLGEGRCWLLLLDQSGLGERLADRLPAGDRVIRVRPGSAFGSVGVDTYEIRPGSREDHIALGAALREAKLAPGHIVHLWGVAGEDRPVTTAATVDAALNDGFYSLLWLVQSLAEQFPTESVQIDVVCNDLFDVVGGEGKHPDRAAMLGPCRVVPQEHENFRCRLIDVELAQSNGSDRTVEQLAAECLSASDDGVVAYRGPHRWLQAHDPVHIEPAKQAATGLKDGGVVLITGGLGGIGLVMAEHFADSVNAKLVLVGRSGLPPKSKWDWWLKKHGGQDRVGKRIAKVKDLEQRGAEVMVASADVADIDQMREVVARARVRFGAIDAVVHAAGLSTGGMAALRGADAAAEVLDPKVKGTLVLQEVLADDKLDFFVLCSSVSAILGGIGGADYCGANSFLDALASSADLGGKWPFICVNWDAWTEVGMAAETEVPEEIRKDREADLAEGILSVEGKDVLARLLEERPRQVAVFTRDLDVKTVESQGWQGYAAEEEDEELTPTDSRIDSGGGSLHPRPDLPQEYVEPSNAVEKAVAEVASELLGIDKVGVNDNFFDLGFDSLLAHRMIGRLQDPLQMGLPLRVILEMPSVGEIAKFVEGVATSGSEVTNP